MTANNDTPSEGQDSIDRWRAGEEALPFRDESDVDLALELEGQKTEAKDAVNAVTRALLNDDEPLTDAQAVRLAEAADALVAMSESIMVRVCEEDQKE